MEIKNKNKKLTLLSIFIGVFLIIGCSQTEKYTKFQNAYFEISNSDKSFSQDDLESIVGTKVSIHKNAKNEGGADTYIFEINDEELKIFLNDDMKLDFIQYTKIGEMTLVNNLEQNTSVGEYGPGFTSEFKLDSIEQQKKIFDEINK